jgi:hypothetical protein
MPARAQVEDPGLEAADGHAVVAVGQIAREHIGPARLQGADGLVGGTR